MPETRVALSGYRPVWLFAMFDLPTVTKADKRRYVQFRNHLLNEGFGMLQYSVYARYCPSEDSSQAYRYRIRERLPPSGQVRLLAVTDRQFGKMEVFFGKKRTPTEDPPSQLMLF